MFKCSLVLSSLILLVLVQTAFQQPASLPASVTAAMASREMRYHHLIWHNVRNQWNSLDRATQDRLRSMGWACPRPSRDRNGRTITNNDSGEDFFWMHRQMMNRVNSLLRAAGASTVSGFSTIPAANDRSFPMPGTYSAGGSANSLINYYKSNSYYNYLKQQERRIQSTSFLRSMTLGEFGSWLEFASDVHQGLHYRFSERSSPMRSRTSALFPNVNRRFDVPSSNWLVDLYSSQANPWFWKVHGWVDNCIRAWARANGVSNIRWRGTWTGGSMDNLPSNLNIPRNSASRFLMGKMESDTCGKSNLQTLEEVHKILVKAGVACDYYDDLCPKKVPKNYS